MLDGAQNLLACGLRGVEAACAFTQAQRVLGSYGGIQASARICSIDTQLIGQVIGLHGVALQSEHCLDGRLPIVRAQGFQQRAFACGKRGTSAGVRQQNLSAARNLHRRIGAHDEPVVEGDGQFLFQTNLRIRAFAGESADTPSQNSTRPSTSRVPWATCMRVPVCNGLPVWAVSTYVRYASKRSVVRSVPGVARKSPG